MSNTSDKPSVPDPSASGKVIRAGLQAAGGAIPFVGGLLSAAASYWSESEQETVNNVFKQWLQMLEDELREKAQTIFEITARLDLNDETIKERIQSEEYKSILKKAFRNWSKIDTDEKRKHIRNLLANSAAKRLTSDDVVKLFVDWIADYSDFHFHVIGAVYQNPGATRQDIWEILDRPEVRENSADADLFKLLMRDLSTGGVIRQRRETDGEGHFLKKARDPRVKPFKKGNDPRMKSAFDDKEEYFLTEIGNQFVHYVLNELVPRIDFKGFDQATSDMPGRNAPRTS